MVGSCSSKSTVIREMQDIQDTLAAFYHRIEVIENSLKSSLLGSDERENMEKELQDIIKKLSNLESSLQGLRRENSKTFAFAALLMFFSFLGYGLYVMIVGPP
uniref:Coiled-coil domain-containing protein 167 n=1 Tax=Graphocephala atropunctata TaxID=36148 RepID=A0A1B6KIU1_9HEMI